VKTFIPSKVGTITQLNDNLKAWYSLFLVSKSPLDSISVGTEDSLAGE